jgi:D-beta-D-heptose 7-phosphate kinase/D-beta-D-heptose 1-phosphate adenosyltransferase
VAVNSDASVRQLKGANRPVQPCEARLAVLAALEAVDFLVVFDDATPLELIRRIRPDVLVKGGDYRPQEVIGADFVQSYCGRVHIAAYHDGFSTTALIHRLMTATVSRAA